MYKKHNFWEENITNKEIANFLGFTERAIYKYKKKNKNKVNINNKKANEKPTKKINNKQNNEENKKYNVYSSAKLALFLNKNRDNLDNLKLEIKGLKTLINICCNYTKHKNDAFGYISDILEFIEKIEKYLDFEESKA